jgi:hypothetical protein
MFRYLTVKEQQDEYMFIPYVASLLASDSTETTNARLIDVQSRWCPPRTKGSLRHCVTNCSSFTRGETSPSAAFGANPRVVCGVRLQDYILDTVSRIGYHTKFLVDKLRSERYLYV